MVGWWMSDKLERVSKHFPRIWLE